MGISLSTARRAIIKKLMRIVENEISIDDYPILKLLHMDSDVGCQ